MYIYYTDKIWIDSWRPLRNTYDQNFIGFSVTVGKAVKIVINMKRLRIISWHCVNIGCNWYIYILLFCENAFLQAMFIRVDTWHILSLSCHNAYVISYFLLFILTILRQISIKFLINYRRTSVAYSRDVVVDLHTTALFLELNFVLPPENYYTFRLIEM